MAKVHSGGKESHWKLLDQKQHNSIFYIVFQFFQAPPPPLQTQKNDICAILKSSLILFSAKLVAVTGSPWSVSLCWGREQQVNGWEPCGTLCSHVHPPLAQRSQNHPFKTAWYCFVTIIWASSNLKTPRLISTNYKAYYLHWSLCQASHINWAVVWTTHRSAEVVFTQTWRDISISDFYYLVWACTEASSRGVKWILFF